MLTAIGADADEERVVATVRGMLARKQRVPGFGHRVYRTEDPRATHLRQMSRDLGQQTGDTRWFEISERIEAVMKADTQIDANVDFYSASTYHTLGNRGRSVHADLRREPRRRLDGARARAVCEQPSDQTTGGVHRPGASSDVPAARRAVARLLPEVRSQKAEVRRQKAASGGAGGRRRFCCGPTADGASATLRASEPFYNGYSFMDQRHIRNFSIIAHIDHGKSTLADRFLEITGALRPREMEAQVLDSMDLERERGITIKAHAVRLTYTPEGGVPHVLNLIDTPGHVDFSYEVTRALTACEGAVLLVDASQGVEAQTVANAYLAVDQNLEIVPVVNKIDLPGAQPEETSGQIEEIVGLDAADAIMASAKEGDGTRAILDAVVARVPPPAGDRDAPLKALIFDSWYDSYRGVIVLVRMVDGVVRPKMKVRLMAQGQDYEIEELGVFSPKPVVVPELAVGEVGWVIAGIKTVSDAQIGDTITETAQPTAHPCAGFTEVKPMVFAGLYPVEGHQYAELREALEKLRLNDALVLLRARNLLGPGVRVPLWVPGVAPHGNHPGTVGAGIRHGSRHHGAGRALPGDHHRRRDVRGRQPSEAAGRRPYRCPRGARHHGDDSDAVGLRRGCPAALPGEARGPERARVSGDETAS